ncbi:hypothetical protein [Pseudoxanthomonas sp. CF125]|uniref:hypothetical protein n=1 Tax=Pseudoxanthomonas sp. CF125 TaxID=1855303 RepID=UPI000B81B5C1|nr:hypothetical protein [Pseudoxanthomonas sp. CF125]
MFPIRLSLGAAKQTAFSALAPGSIGIVRNQVWMRLQASAVDKEGGGLLLVDEAGKRPFSIAAAFAANVLEFKTTEVEIELGPVIKEDLPSDDFIGAVTVLHDGIWLVAQSDGSSLFGGLVILVNLLTGATRPAHELNVRSPIFSSWRLFGRFAEKGWATIANGPGDQLA